MQHWERIEQHGHQRYQLTYLELLNSQLLGQKTGYRLKYGILGEPQNRACRHIIQMKGSILQRLHQKGTGAAPPKISPQSWAHSTAAYFSLCYCQTDTQWSVVPYILFGGAMQHNTTHDLFVCT